MFILEIEKNEKKKKKKRMKDKPSTSCGNPKKVFPISHFVGITLIILILISVQQCDFQCTMNVLYMKQDFRVKKNIIVYVYKNK